MSDRYELWNRALIDEYFPEGGVQRLAYLPVDDDELRALAESEGLCPPEKAVDDFVSAVCAELAVKDGSFARFAAWVKGWRAVRDHPPYLAGLALCVLAASRMASDVAAGISASNYYARLNALIGRDEKAGQPPGFDTLREVWADLERWLDEDCGGARGKSTIRGHPTWVHVGYPLSQALLRACDRRRLPDFFAAADLEPGSDISLDRLFVLLRAWSAQPSCGLTPSARAKIEYAAKDEDETAKHEIAETVKRELDAWDGRLRDPRGRLRFPLHLHVRLRPRGATVRLVAPVSKDFPLKGWTDARTGAPVAVQVFQEGWALAVTPAIKRILAEGLHLVNGDIALSFESAAAVPLREAPPDLGGFLSRPQATLLEPHIAVVTRAHAEELVTLLSGHTEGKVRLHPKQGELPDGWCVTNRFQLTSVPPLAKKEFSRLIPRLVASTSLQGGLRLATGLYLEGGEPDVLVSSDQEVAVEVDGVVVARGEAHRIKLSDRELSPGSHTVKAEHTRTFTTTYTLGDIVPSGAGSLGHRFERHRSFLPRSVEAEPIQLEQPAGALAVAGAAILGDPDDLPLGDRRRYLVRAGGRRYFVIGAVPGEILELEPTGPPKWLHRLGLADQFQFLETSPPFEPAWALIEGSSGDRRVRPLVVRRPESESAGDRLVLWIETVLDWAGASPTKYAEEWGDVVATAQRLQERV